MKTLKTLALAAVLALAAGAASAHEYKLGDLEIGHPWSRATPNAAPVGAGYMTVTNKGKTADRLVAAGSDISSKVEIHEMAVIDGVMKMRALDKGIEAARQNVLVKRGAFYPKVAATAQYQQVDGGGKLMPDGFTLGMGAEWEFWPGGKRRHELREAESQTRQLELQRAGVARLVETDVRQAHARALEAVGKIKREKGASRLGEEGQELAELRFQEGAGIQAETLDAELALTTARTGLAKALRDYAVALTDLERALGGGLPGAAQAEQ